LKHDKQTSTAPNTAEGGKIVSAVLKENNITVSATEDIQDLTTRGYGTQQNQELNLTFYEALFLLSKGIIRVQDAKTKKEIDFQKLLSSYKATDPNAWAKYLTYRDLRSRGYVVREGFGLGTDFRVYERGEYGTATAKNLVFGIQEGQPVSMDELARTLRYAHSQKKQLVLAVLNRRGEVVYYSLSQLTLKKRQVT